MKPRPLIDGLLEEGTLITFTGGWNRGKSPLVKDWAVAIASGQDWCGCKVAQHPVIILDFESQDYTFFEGKRENGGWDHICKKRGVNPADLPVTFFFDHGDPDLPRTTEMKHLLTLSAEKKFAWLDSKLSAVPNAIVFIDPIQRFLNFDRNKATQVVSVYNEFWKMQSKYRRATFLSTFNMKKLNRQFPPPPLIEQPRNWLEELPGANELQSRGDIRLGIEPLNRDDEDEPMPIVVNGAIREDTMEPFVLEPEWFEERTAGFQRVAAQHLDRSIVLTKRQAELFDRLADTFTQADLDAEMSKSAVHRFKARVMSLGLVWVTGTGAFQKLA